MKRRIQKPELTPIEPRESDHSNKRAFVYFRVAAKEQLTAINGTAEERRKTDACKEHNGNPSDN